MREQRMTLAGVARAAERLSDRDRNVLLMLDRLRVATGRQLERLAFTDLAGEHPDRIRRRVLKRLVDLGLLITLERRIGGVRAGSAGLVFGLSAGGQRLVQQLNANPSDHRRFRQPATPTERFLQHSLDSSELYVQLVEAARQQPFVLREFVVEPASWWQGPDGGWIKPDALLTLGTDRADDLWALEVDRATESLPTLRRKLLVYVEAAEQGDSGPDGVLPRVLLTVPDQRRAQAARTIIEQLPPPAEQLLHVSTHERAVRYLLRRLFE